MTHKPWLTEEYRQWNKRRVIAMPPIPTLMDTWKPGLTAERVLANRAALMSKMQQEIDAGRERRHECLTCGSKLNRYGCCPDGHTA